MVLAKSGKILIFEFKKNPLRTKDLKQAYEYYDRIHCKYKRDVNLIFIVISKAGKLKKYTTMDFTYHPRVIKTKKINKQKDLSIIRDKFIRDVKLTLVESSLLVLYLYLSLKRVKRKLHRKFASISTIKKHCIPHEIFDEVVVAMFFNIREYVGFDKQDELLEMIGMAEKIKGLFAQLKDEGWDEGWDDGRKYEKKEVIKQLLKTLSIDSVSNLLEMDRMDIENILKK